MIKVCVLLLSVIISSQAISQESGYQYIRGTKVFTRIDHATQTATFSNECGSQTISRSRLQAGAIPTDIIPCERQEQTSRSPADEPPPKPEFGTFPIYEYNRAAKLITSGLNHANANNLTEASRDLSAAKRGLDEVQDSISGNIRPILSKELNNARAIAACSDDLFRSARNAAEGTPTSASDKAKIKSLCEDSGALYLNNGLRQLYPHLMATLDGVQNESSSPLCSVISGENKPAQCVNEFKGKNCYCVPLTNNCPNSDAEQRFFVPPAKNRRSATIKALSTNDRAVCTTQKDQSIILGEYRIGRGKWTPHLR